MRGVRTGSTRLLAWWLGVGETDDVGVKGDSEDSAAKKPPLPPLPPSLVLVLFAALFSSMWWLSLAASARSGERAPRAVGLLLFAVSLWVLLLLATPSNSPSREGRGERSLRRRVMRPEKPDGSCTPSAVTPPPPPSPPQIGRAHV